MSASEKAYDVSVRDAVAKALSSIPISALLDLISAYAIPFRSVVTTICGGRGDSPRFKLPYSICAYVDPKTGELSYLVADFRRQFVQLFARDARLSPFAGREFNPSDSFPDDVAPALQWSFRSPAGICVDPLNANRFYLCDRSSVRVLDRTANGGSDGGELRLLAGGTGMWGYADGAGATARFNDLFAVACTRDGATLLLCDNSNHAIRAVATATCIVSTAAGGNSQPRTDQGQFSPTHIVFDRASAEPDSVCYIATFGTIRRFDRKTGTRALSGTTARHLIPASGAGELTSLELAAPAGAGFSPYSLACLPNGVLLFTCSNTHSVWSVHPPSTKGSGGGAAATELIAGSGVMAGSGSADGSALSESRFDSPIGLCFVETGVDARCAVFADSNNRVIRKVTLPPHLFDNPHLH